MLRRKILKPDAVSVPRPCYPLTRLHGLVTVSVDHAMQTKGPQIYNGRQQVYWHSAYPLFVKDLGLMVSWEKTQQTVHPLRIC